MVVGLAMLVPWLQGRAALTERDWLLLFGHPRSCFVAPMLRFAALLLAVAAIGFCLGFYLSHGLGWFVGALILAAQL